MSTAYDQLIEHWRHASRLSSVGSLLSWDQETMMPPGGAAYRAEQRALIAEMTHAAITDPRVGDWLSAAEPTTPQAAANLREIRHSYSRATKLPAELVGRFARATARAQRAWEAARADDDFAAFRPHLETIVALNIEKAGCYGWAGDGEPWDALADGFERGMTAAKVEAVFTPLRDRLVTLIDELAGAGVEPSSAFNEVKAPVDRQMKFVRWVAERFGFDFSRGRLDTAAHPFCGGTHPNDVRMTTRFHEDMLTDALGSTMHESGHGLYEQGLPVEFMEQPVGRAVGLSIHESQSRLWENQVGRSLGFWRWCMPHLGEFFGAAFDALDADDAFAAANRVQRSLIRVESDEATYNLHIMIRFELERAMLRGDLAAADVPAAWGEKYRDYLSIGVPSDRLGCLQDVHWSHGAMGYFPTYTMGNLYGAQFFEAADEALGDVPAMIERGEFAPLLGWLREHVHSVGHLYDSDALCERVTGKPVSADPLIRHLERKLRPLYGLA